MSTIQQPIIVRNVIYTPLYIIAPFTDIPIVNIKPLSMHKVKMLATAITPVIVLFCMGVQVIIHWLKLF